MREMREIQTFMTFTWPQKMVAIPTTSVTNRFLYSFIFHPNRTNVKRFIT